ncbi:multicopper oxidase family protein [Streptomyces cocklensis]|uniref:Multicopper oxidase MmcO n=1 Tax=Actinacidiphila cocklensis TaxID=887465 RepID=A0A9W4DS54_9ACTN|nr:multicopper oxidase family protein [Actinacidiphila cocklensis]MDD1064094.1 multicopper oxidase family protein [Actinacidiphila cocklensis]WSX75708.1 multicopper oxidase family protein [Streptomyces sp. NBC_00899]CAG6395234.1 Multicopper oxidase MmcO [Actinacidiphila cocklensis]
MSGPLPGEQPFGRREVLRLGALAAGTAGLGGLGLLAACSGGTHQAARRFILPTDPEVRRAEAARHRSGRTASFALTAGAATVDLGGRRAHTWTYGGEAVAPELRVGKGDRVRAAVTNRLTEQTTLHWHGIRIRNDMDGNAPVTQAAIAAGDGRFTYDFTVPDPGTYWYHSHSGLQADRGLFGALVVEDPDDRSGADADAVLVLDDWLDGLGTTPDAVLAALNPALGGGGTAGMGGMAGMDHSGSPSASTTGAGTGGGTPEQRTAARLVGQGEGRSKVLGGMTQHIAYPLHLINGRPPNDPRPIRCKPGTRLRLRIVNAGAETPYRFAVAGHELTVVAVDGYDTQPQKADAVLLGMAQRVDVLVTVRSGAWPVVARAEGRPGHAATVLRTTDAAPQRKLPADVPELDGRLVLESALRPAASVRLDKRAPDRSYEVELLRAEGRYQWGIAGRDAGGLVMKTGERVRITMRNTSGMWHPMHTHGHTFAVPAYGGLRRDTVNVLPGTSLAVEFDADNPGEWMFHCHNAYHFEAGMAADLHYIR